MRHAVSADAIRPSAKDALVYTKANMQAELANAISAIVAAQESRESVVEEAASEN
jgi:hypothetical protein